MLFKALLTVLTISAVSCDLSESQARHISTQVDSSDKECSGFRELVRVSDKCDYIQRYCASDGIWNPLEVYYCNAVPYGLGAVMLAASVAWLYILFQLLGATADNFFSPILTQLSQDLGLPPRFAGVTFLALGNGAPDLSSTILAIKSGDYNLSLGALTGAGMFVGTVVAGSCILSAGGAKCRGALIRDSLGYAAAILVLLIVMVDGRVSYLEVMMLLAIYAAFVVSVLGADLWHRLVHLKRQPPEAAAAAAAPPHMQDLELAHTPDSASDDGTCSADPAQRPAGERQAQRPRVSEEAKRGPIDYAHMPAARYRDIAWATLAKSSSFFRRAPSLKNLRQQLFAEGALSSSFMHAESSHLRWVASIAEEHGAEEEDGGGDEGLEQQQPLQGHRFILDEDDDDDSSDEDADDGGGDAGPRYQPPVNGEVEVAPWGPERGQAEAHARAGLTASRSFIDEQISRASTSQASLSSILDAPARRFTSEEQPVWAAYVGQPEGGAEDAAWTRPLGRGRGAREWAAATAAELRDGLFMQSWDEIREMGPAGRLNLALLAPFTLLQRATIPVIVSEAYSQAWLVVALALCPVWMTYYLGLAADAGAAAWGGALAVGGVLAAAAALTSGRDSPPEWSCGSKILFGAALMCTLGFAIAATWIAAIATELVTMLQFFGNLSGVDSAVLGLTVLAWGNSVGDLSTNVAMAKRGLSNMALTACFAGPLFNLLVGCALGFLLWLRQEQAAFVPARVSTPVLIGGMFILLNCVSLVTIGILNGKRVPRSTGYFMQGVYALYVVVSLVCLFVFDS
mmetsp:Transcript_10638/g.25223  ORF Transcript_10638/g.25223 Transcript_10638/m.25223 type:complete len:798 (+) Transcript_10638:335-2728(+)